MKPQTIQSELAAYLKANNLTISQFAEISGINSGTLSRIINGNRSISMGQLERITAGMELPDGSFFDMYINESFIHSSPTWRRLHPFLMRSAELGMLHCIQRVVQVVMDNLNYAPLLFKAAEEMFGQGRQDAAALLYKGVSVTEKYQHSERLALCHYRLFLITIGNNQDTNLRAATLFECYVDRLNELDQLDALKHLAHIYASLHQWDKVDELGQKLHQIAIIQYALQSQSRRNEEEQRRTEQPLFGYILYSDLLRSAVCEAQGDYTKAMHYVSLYADVSWVQENTEEAQRLLKQFSEWATANTYLYRLMSGERDVLYEYADYISSKKDEIFIALLNILKAANLYQYNVDDILERFASYIPYKTYRNEIGEYNKQIMDDRYAQFLSELTTYYDRRLGWQLQKDRRIYKP